MKLIFERGAPGRGCDLVPPCTCLLYTSDAADE